MAAHPNGRSGRHDLAQRLVAVAEALDRERPEGDDGTAVQLVATGQLGDLAGYLAEALQLEDLQAAVSQRWPRAP